MYPKNISQYPQMDVCMKKISIYSLLFACLLALNPVLIKADSKQFLGNLLRNHLTLLLVSTVGLGVASVDFFNDCVKNRNEWLNFRDQAASAGTEQTKTKYQTIAKYKLNTSAAGGVMAALCLSTAIYSGYLSYKAIQQARS
jgi:hypothetical protein